MDAVLKRVGRNLVSAPVLIRITEASKMIGVSTVTLRRRVRNNEISHHRDHGRIYFTMADLEAYVASKRHAGG